MFRIAIDIDEVCNNLMESVLTIYNKRHGTNYILDDCQNFDLHKNFEPDAANEMYELFGAEDVQAILRPIDDAQWGIETLMNMGYQVYFATATTPQNFGWKANWLLKNFPFINSHQIIDIYNKGILNVDVLIDDHIDNLISGFYDRVCLDRPWNRNIRDDLFEIYRCLSWREIIKIIEKLERKNKEWEKE